MPSTSAARRTHDDGTPRRREFMMVDFLLGPTSIRASAHPDQDLDALQQVAGEQHFCWLPPLRLMMRVQARVLIWKERTLDCTSTLAVLVDAQQPLEAVQEGDGAFSRTFMVGMMPWALRSSSRRPAWPARRGETVSPSAPISTSPLAGPGASRTGWKPARCGPPDQAEQAQDLARYRRKAASFTMALRWRDAHEKSSPPGRTGRVGVAFLGK